MSRNQIKLWNLAVRLGFNVTKDYILSIDLNEVPKKIRSLKAIENVKKQRYKRPALVDKVKIVNINDFFASVTS